MNQQIQELVEELRSTGFHGREAWLPSIGRQAGTAIAAIRQLEVCASQMVSPWFDGVMDEQELWFFLRSHFLPRLLSLEEIVDNNVARTKILWRGADDDSFHQTWTAIQRQIRAVAATNELPDYGEFAVTLLVSVMVLRQWIEAEYSKNTTGGCFVGESTNVAGEFFAQSLAKAGFKPLHFAETSLRRLAERICSQSSEGKLLSPENPSELRT